MDAMKNFHVPLPDPIYESLQLEARRSQVPVTSVTREAIQTWLTAREGAVRRKAIATYAAKMAATEFDLDSILEAGALGVLQKTR
jgi:hypothetical protein